jgi:hypothetical protein
VSDAFGLPPIHRLVRVLPLKQREPLVRCALQRRVSNGWLRFGFNPSKRSATLCVKFKRRLSELIRGHSLRRTNSSGAANVSTPKIETRCPSECGFTTPPLARVDASWCGHGVQPSTAADLHWRGERLQFEHPLIIPRPGGVQ